MTITEPFRPEPSMTGGEREQLIGFLDYQRATVVWKATGVSDEQSRLAHTPSELTTLAGLVGHLTLVEYSWFEEELRGAPDIWGERLAVDRDAEFREAMARPIAEVVADYEAQCESSRQAIAEMDLEHVVTRPGRTEQLNLRWVLIHMIEETARHAGHMDILREITDGLTGE